MPEWMVPKLFDIQCTYCCIFVRCYNCRELFAKVPRPLSGGDRHGHDYGAASLLH